MTIDPNNPAPDPQLELNPPAAGDPPAPAPAPTGPTAEEVADLVIAKLRQAAEPEPEPVRATPAMGVGHEDYLRELGRQASDPQDPRQAGAIVTLRQEMRRLEEDEWNALGVPPGHPARVLFAQNPAAFSGRPMHAFTVWENQEMRRKVAEAEAAKGKESEPEVEDQERERARKVRDSAPGMPSRSVQPTARAGRRGTHFANMDAYLAAVRNDPTLEDRFDRGEITFD